jgi:predicted enzyme related to lactoylglutathione lyase
MANNAPWFAINADDVPRAKRFYEQIFGWKLQPWGPPNFYLIKSGKDQAVEIGGLQERRELVPGAKIVGFECTFNVADIDQAIGSIEANGGKILAPKFHIPTVGTIVYFLDTEGNVVGARQPERQDASRKP